jgi:hypothetical protein
MSAGVTRPLTHSAKRIREAIDALGVIPFSVQDIMSKTDCSVPTISYNIGKYIKAGKIQKVDGGQYQKKNGEPLPLGQLSKGLVVTAVWEALNESRDRFLTRSDIIALASHRAEVDQSLLGGSTSMILTFWYRDGHLIRMGVAPGYLYQLKPSVTERPVTSNRALLPA